MTDWKELNSMNPQNIWKLNVIFGSIKKCCWKICSLPLRWSFLWERAMCVLPDKWSATAPFSWWWRPCGWWARELLRWWDDDENKKRMRFVKMRMMRWGWGWVYNWNDKDDDGCDRVVVVRSRVARIVAALQPGCEEMEREWGNEEEMERKWGNG